MRSVLLLAFAFGLLGVPPSANLPPDYEQSVLQARQEQAKALTGPESWFSLVALQPLTEGDVSVGSAPGNTLRLEHGVPHAFTLHVAGRGVTLVAVDPAVALDGKHPRAGDPLPTTERQDSTLTWNDQYAYVIERTGGQTYLRVGDHHAPNLVHFHGLKFYPVNPAYRITARWVPYTTPHEIHMATVLGTTLVVPSPGYAEFPVEGQTVRLDAMGTDKHLEISFRDGTYKTTTYGAGRHVEIGEPSNGVKSPGAVVIDFNTATNWPCAYTPYGTCPLPPPQNRFNALIPAGEMRYHD